MSQRPQMVSFLSLSCLIRLLEVRPEHNNARSVVVKTEVDWKLESQQTVSIKKQCLLMPLSLKVSNTSLTFTFSDS